jgi:hypothetical protein
LLGKYGSDQISTKTEENPHAELTGASAWNGEPMVKKDQHDGYGAQSVEPFYLAYQNQTPSVLSVASLPRIWLHNRALLKRDMIWSVRPRKAEGI